MAIPTFGGPFNYNTEHLDIPGALTSAAQYQGMQTQNALRTTQLQDEIYKQKARNALMEVYSPQNIDAATKQPTEEALNAYTARFPEPGNALRQHIQQQQQHAALMNKEIADTKRIDMDMRRKMLPYMFDLSATQEEAYKKALKNGRSPEEAQSSALQAGNEKVDALESLGVLGDKAPVFRSGASHFDPVKTPAFVQTQKNLLAQEAKGESAWSAAQSASNPTRQFRVNRNTGEAEFLSTDGGMATWQPWMGSTNDFRLLNQPSPELVGQRAGAAAAAKAEETPEKAPTGYRQSKDKPGTLEYIPGGPADPETKAAQKTAIQVTGGRESVYSQRVINAAGQGARDAENLAKIPWTTGGIFTGRRQGPGLLDAVKEDFANAVTGQESRAYNIMASGLQRSLAQIETQGLAQGVQEFSKQIDITSKPGDDRWTQMHRFAQIRQIIDTGLETVLANPRISDPEKELARKTLERVDTAIPFTHADLLELESRQSKNKKATLRDVLKKESDKAGIVSGGAVATEPTPSTPTTDYSHLWK